MRIAVLTTDTVHHTYFIREIAKELDIVGVVIESPASRPTFHTSHPFEMEMEKYENQTWFDNKTPKIDALVDSIQTDSINNKLVVKYLTAKRPDIVVAFGVRKIKPDLINLFENRIVNLHGGNPEEYRGLDSHLWAIYHKDFDNLVTTLHHLNETLDDGDIILMDRINISKGMNLLQLRRKNTEVCIDLVSRALKIFSEKGRFPSRAQEKKGRYYSFMPACLKEITVATFNRYAETLNEATF